MYFTHEFVLVKSILKNIVKCSGTLRFSKTYEFKKIRNALNVKIKTKFLYWKFV